METQATSFKEKAQELVRYIDAMVVRFMLTESEIQDEFSNLNKQELKLIRFLGNSGPCNMSEITDYIMLGNSAVTAIVDKLVDKDCVRRFRVPQDRRMVKVKLTRSGRKIYRTEVKKYLNLSRGMLQSLDETEQDQLLALLRKISEQARSAGSSA